MITTVGRAKWSGYKAEYCRSCCKLFANTVAGDAHRTGSHGVKEGPRRRRCLTTEEMQGKIVRTGARKGEPWFVVKENKYGTEVWSRSQAADTRWEPVRQFTEALAGPPGTPGTPDPLEALKGAA